MIRELERPRDDPGHPIDRDAGGPTTYLRDRLPNEPRFVPNVPADRRRASWR